MTRREMSLHFNISGVGHANYGWRHPASGVDRALDLPFYIQLARTAERGLFDSIFIADTPALRGDPNDVLANTPFEPITLLSALAAVTDHIGLVPTVSTSYSDPFTIARQIASLDLLSNGRAGVNLVTSAGDAVARNHGRDSHIEHGLRYRRAEEFAEVLNRLWASWGADALIRDRASGVMADRGRIEAIDHAGEFFSVAGPLPVPPSPQGRPLVVQAGASPSGLHFAGRFADAIYARSMSIEEAAGTYRGVKAAAVTAGRHPDSIKVLPGVVPYVAATDAEARGLVAEIDALTPEPSNLLPLQGMLGTDLSSYGPQDRVWPGLLPDPAGFNGSVTGLIELREIASRDGATFGDLARSLSGRAPLGMWALIGSGETVADQLQHWFDNGAADGFNLMMPTAPGGIEAFVDHVVPILQERGIFRTRYESSTLRSNLGVSQAADLASVASSG
jgi:N-acetyl-S-(2-succino)cysteine monooxygenase